MPQGQRTLTEADGVVEIGPVGPVTQKELAPAQAHTSRKRDAAEAAAQPAAARRAARGHATAAQGRSDRQPAAAAAQRGGSSGKLRQVANNNTTPNKPVPPPVINLVHGCVTWKRMPLMALEPLDRSSQPARFVVLDDLRLQVLSLIHISEPTRPY